MPLIVPYNIKPERVNPNPGANFIAEPAAGTPLFAGDPKLTDIAQGTIADCAFLSSLIAILHRANGVQFIQNMMVEDTKTGLVTVRLYEDGRPIYLQTPKCRVKNVAENAPVSTRKACWPDVLEVCASIFSMKTALDKPTRTLPSTLENLNLATPRHTLAVLTGSSICSKEIPDERPLNINTNYAHGTLTVVFDASQAPDRQYRDEVVAKAFGAKTAEFNQWAANNSTIWTQYIQSHRHSQTGVTIKTNTFATFLQRVPKQFHMGLHELDKQNNFLQGRGLEAKFTANQEAFFDHIAQAIQNGYPTVLVTRLTVGRGGGTTSALGEDMYKGMLGGHCYGVDRTHVDMQSQMKWIHITNPWGRYVRAYDPITGKSIAVENKGGLGAGRFSVTLHDLMKKFDHYAYAERKLLF